MKVAWTDDRGVDQLDDVISTFSHNGQLWAVIAFDWGTYSNFPPYRIVQGELQ